MTILETVATEAFHFVCTELKLAGEFLPPKIGTHNETKITVHRFAFEQQIEQKCRLKLKHRAAAR